jgi:hypothetical protein
MAQRLPSEVRLPAWKGFYPGRKSETCTGVLSVDHHGSRPSPRQIAALDAAVARAARMKPRILDAIVESYATLRQWSRRPKRVTVTQLSRLIAPWELLVTTDHFEGEGYVAYGFSCAWDPSGITVLTHGERVVSVGDFDVLTYPHADPLRAPPKPKGSSPAKMKAAIARAQKRAKKNPAALPDDTVDEMWIHLPEWAGFVAGNDEVASSEVGISVGGDQMGASDLGPAQQAAYRRVVRGAKAQQGRILDAIASHFGKLTRGAEVALPKEVDRKALRGLVTLTTVHLHWPQRNGLAYVGYELACAWDSEHGVGVMTHGERIVAIGQADTAILGWVAERDLKKSR